MEEGVECVVEVVREREVYRGVLVMARSEEDCDVECASVFTAVVQKVMEAKTEFVTASYLRLTLLILMN